MNRSLSRFVYTLTGVLLFVSPSIVAVSAASTAEPPVRQTSVSIVGDRFFINGQPTYAGRTWQNHRIEGLLMNTRMVQGIFDDLNPATVGRWVYPDTGKWDADRNTREFIAAMPQWKAYGVLAFTLNLQGGSPQGYSNEQPWINSAFAPDGSLRPEYMARLARILDEADRLGMVVILGYFYFGQDERVTDEAAVRRAVDHATHWILDHGYTNVVIEVNNECDVKKYDHAILQSARVSELIARVKAIVSGGRRLLVGTSFGGGSAPTDNVLAVSDFALVHGNGKDDPERIRRMARETRARAAWHAMPLVVNEDDHFDFEKPDNHLLAALGENASWGYFDPGESNYRDGYQCPPVNWGINTPRKQAFFQKIAEITGAHPAAVAPAATVDGAPAWTTVVATAGQMTRREECSFVAYGGRFFLLGGRGISPVDIFDPKTQAWSQGARPPVEVHHFQPVVWDRQIYLACGMTGKYPREQALDRILIYDPEKDVWSWGATIPAGRRRGSAGVVVHDGALVLVCGIINGHTDGWVNWCDTFDFKSGQWTVLPDAPRMRDHFEAAVIDGRLYAAGGRRSSAITQQVFDLTIPEVDVYDFASKTWSTLPAASNLPTPRAGASTVAVGADLIVFGGESMAQSLAHAEVQALDTRTGQWRNLPPLRAGRHGTSVVYFDGAFYTCAGAGKRGGSPLLSTMEMLKLPGGAAR
jgi:N-acetylneuraminic acid mutarotase